MSTNKIKLSLTLPDRHDPPVEPDDMSNVVTDMREGGGWVNRRVRWWRESNGGNK